MSGPALGIGRTLRALLWLRYRTLLNGVKAARGRDTLERSSRILGLVVGALATLFSLAVAVGLGWVGWTGGRAVGSGHLQAGPILLLVRLGLLAPTALLVLAPLGRSMHTQDSGSSRLALLPISRHVQHAAQLVSGLFDLWILPVIPFLLLVPAGFAAGGKGTAAALTLAAGLAFLLALAATGSVTALAIQAFLRRRGRAEITALLFFGLLSMAGMIPAFLGEGFERKATEQKRYGSVEAFDRAIPTPLRILPSELYGSAVRTAIEGRSLGSLAASGGLLGLGTLLYAFSSRLYRRLLDAPEEGSARRQGPARGLGFGRWPGLSSAASAVARVQIRSTLRTLRGKFTVFFTGPMVAFMGMSLRRAGGSPYWKDFLSHHGYMLVGGAAFMALSSAQPLLSNLFTVDKAGLTRQFLAPIRDRDLLLGKMAGAGLLFALTLVFCLTGIALVLPGRSPLAWAAGFVGGLSAYLLAAPLLALLSMTFPKASDLNKMGNPGNPHGVAALISVLVAAGACTPPALLLGLGTSLLGLPWLTLGLIFLWMLVAGAFAYFLTAPLARALAERRENLILVAERR